MGHCEAIDTTGDDTQLIPWDHWAHTGPDTREKMGPLVLVVLYCWTLASQIIFVIGKQIDKLIDMYYCQVQVPGLLVIGTSANQGSLKKIGEL